MSATLLLVPPEGGTHVLPETPLLGLPLVRRTALAARRAGFAEVLARGIAYPGASVLEETGARLISREDPTPPDAATLPWNAVVTVQDLKALREGRPRLPGVLVVDPWDLPRAERYLLKSLVKETDGFMARHIDRRISVAVTRLLADSPVTPNAMTFVAVAIGLFGAPFFLSTQPELQFIGGLFFLLHSILDGCDGELARLKLQESRLGAALDFWGDNVVHVAVFSCMALGWARAAGATWPLAFGAGAVLGTIFSAGLVFLQTMSSAPQGFTSVTGGPPSRLSRMADALARRDFIYLVFLLSAFGKAHWFLAAAGIGAPLYFLVLLAISLGQQRPARVPS